MILFAKNKRKIYICLQETICWVPDFCFVRKKTIIDWLLKCYQNALLHLYREKQNFRHFFLLALQKK